MVAVEMPAAAVWNADLADLWMANVTAYVRANNEIAEMNRTRDKQKK